MPQRTLHDWAQKRVFVPDFNDLRPKQWSYRDLVLVRLFVWLRGAGQTPANASRHVDLVRSLLETASDDALPVLRGDHRALLIEDEQFDRATGDQIMEGLGALMSVFDFAQELPDVGKPMWGPNLVRPSEYTSILPLVMAGEPCIATTRITTANVWTLQHDRGLSAGEIADLYPGLNKLQVRDAIELESKLRPAA
ncbi:MAG TPA: DUF433 domain-containing protein [Acidimicrobiales bacterium]|nr:DUF433 domain-containing protein [Acidimicrobiales bacterium]